MKPITRQEKRILELIGMGYSTRKIAVALEISFHTVQSYRRSLLKKYGAANSAELVRLAIVGNDLERLNPDLE